MLEEDLESMEACAIDMSPAGHHVSLGFSHANLVDGLHQQRHPRIASDSHSRRETTLVRGRRALVDRQQAQGRWQ